MTEHEHTDTSGEERLAPGALRHVQELINTHELDHRTDAIADPDSLAAWLAEHELAPKSTSLTDADVVRVQAVREGLRAAALVHNGHPADPAALAALDEEVRRAPLEVRFHDGRPELTPAGDGVTAAIGRVLAIVARAEADGTWARFKACAADDCQWAFYDHSRNRSRTWCSMEVCGNRAKARAYRERAGRPR